MERQMGYTGAPTLGSFWRLVLLIASREATRVAEAAQCGANRDTAVANCFAPFDDTRELPAYSDAYCRLAGRTEARSISAHSITFGPFLTMILTLHSPQANADRLHGPDAPLKATLVRAELDPTNLPCRTPGPAARYLALVT